MILRVLPIVVALAAAAALWFGYGELRVLRGTPFWEYRFILFACAAFAGLSVLEWALGWLKTKFGGTPDDH